ncbi:hypothetical protein [Deinococcus xianganensis]|uniref:hypothetical protein n=1 Tax=Deinococcus xianganensis TaxID=1507289 RepID=UPI0019255315|nr:hypothetical protein [Deinococcus xianganensis]
MNNGKNNWGVSFSHIQWLIRFLEGHDNIHSYDRSEDILFELTRVKQGDKIKILCLNEYTFSSTKLRAALHEFPDICAVYIGGGWNGYTPEALTLSAQRGVGIYVTDDLTGALWRDNVNGYVRKDDRGDPIYRFSRESD